MIDSINTICKDTALGLNLDEKLVKRAYAHYWHTTKTCVASGLYTSIWLKGIGTLTISRLKLHKAIHFLIWRLRAIKEDRKFFTRKTQAQCLQQCMDSLRLLCARRNEVANIYKYNLDRTQERYDTKHKEHLEE